MASSKYFSQEVVDNYRVLIYDPKSLLSLAIQKQLSKYSYLQNVFFSSSADLKSTAHSNILIYPLGNKLVSHLSMQCLLDYVYENHTRLYIISSASSQKNLSEVLTQLNHYPHKQNVQYKIIEHDSSLSVDKNAASIIKQFVYGHTVPAGIMTVTTKKKAYSHKFIYSLLLVFLPWFATLMQSILIIFFTLLSFSQIGAGNINLAAKSSSASYRMSTILLPQLPYSFGSSQLLSSSGLSPELVTSFLQSYSDSLASLRSINSSYSNMSRSILTTGISLLELEPLNFQLTITNESLALLQVSLRDIYLSSGHPPAFLSKIANHVVNLRQIIYQLQIISPDLPALLGQSKKLTYLFLVQDNTEIRSSGGYLDTVIIATMDKGLLTEFDFRQTNITDAQFYGHVEPPAQLKTVTGISQWQLRDSNWDPDFPSTANKVAWFVEKETAKKIDVVVSLNSSMLPELLAASNSLHISSPSINLTSQNVIKEYLDNIQKESSSLLLKIAQTYISAVKLNHKFDYSKLTQSIIKNIVNGQIQIAPLTFSVSSLDKLNWSGELGSRGCTSTTCSSDYFYVVDSNIGGTKNDYSIIRRRQISLNLKPEMINYSYKLTYTNTAKQNIWPQGNYKNYVRIYLSSDAVIEKILIDGKSQTEATYQQYSEHGLMVVGVLIDIPINTTSAIEIVSRRPVLKIPISYQLVLPHQPGVSAYNEEILLEYPQSWYVTSYFTPSVASQGLLRYNMLSTASKSLNLDFRAKP